MYFDENNNYFDFISNDKEYEINKYVDKTKSFTTNINIDSINFNRDNNNLLSPLEGFNKGNMFNNLYSQYKNHVYKLSVNNKQDELLYKIQMYNFAIKDLGLYLDIYPNDTKILNELLTYKNNLDILKREYSINYNPITINEVNDKTNWSWINNPWPWDKGGNE